MEKKLTPFVTSWSYIVNENNNAIRLSLEGFGSCTPVGELQNMINKLKPEEFDNLWNECENKKDKID
jgi:hypothetical protein